MANINSNTITSKVETSPWMNAISKGNLAEICKLTTSGTDVNASDKFGLTPLYLIIKHIDTLLSFATSDEILQAFKLLLDNGAVPQIQDRRGNTPISYVVQHAKPGSIGFDLRTKIGKMLLAHDQDVSKTIQIKNNMGKSPLDYLARSGNLSLRDAVYTKLPHVKEAMQRTMAENDSMVRKILETTA